MPKVLVTGGAGYIGSHTSLALTQAGYEVVVYDNLSTGHKEAVLPPARLVEGDLQETDKLDKLMAEEKFEAIVHFAASIVVPESVADPIKYYMNNTANTTALIGLALKNNIPRFVFSSTAAVYGMPDTPQVTEQSPLAPINPYGRSKLMSEWIIQDSALANENFKYIILRYFNVAGADPGGRIGQSTPNATHLIKVSSQAALGQREQMNIFGTDYDTFDGTGVRDYIHVADLADVHVSSLQHLEKTGQSSIYNCGYGRGYSVRQIVDTVKKVSQTEFKVVEAERRPGDPGELVSNADKLKQEMGWQAKHNDIEEIVRSAYEWEKKLA